MSAKHGSINYRYKRRKIRSQNNQKMHERAIKTFMDTIIMAELQNGSISGYDVITLNKRRIYISKNLPNRG